MTAGGDRQDAGEEGRYGGSEGAEEFGKSDECELFSRESRWGVSLLTTRSCQQLYPARPSEARLPRLERPPRAQEGDPSASEFLPSGLKGSKRKAR